MSLLRELQRRNVLRVAAAYVAVAWLIVQVVETLFPVFGLSDAAIRTVVIVLAICFIPAVIVSWAFELTPEGFKREEAAEHDTPVARKSARRLDRFVMAALAIALTYFVIDEIFFEQTAPLTEAERSIAVLPFVNMSSDPEQEYFSDGISEEMLNLLAKIPELRVISRTSAFQYKNTDLEITEIAEELRVAHVLEGSVRKSGNTIRITAQLIHAPTDAHVWSDTWDRELDDIFAIQDEIAAEVVRRLQVELVGPPPQLDSVDPEAYLLFLEADHLMLYGLPDGTYEGAATRAIELLERALEIEPDYVDALTELSLALWREWNHEGHRDPNDPRALRSTELADRALALAPDDPTVLTYQAYALLTEPGQTAEAAAMFEKALTIGPTDEDAMRTGLLFARSIGRWDAAIRIGRFNTSRSPKCAHCYYQLSQVYRDAGRLQEAKETGEIARALGMNLDFSIARTELFQGNPEPMLAQTDNWSSSSWQSVSYAAMAKYTAGLQEESDALMSELVDEFSETFPFVIAQAYAWRGDADEAFEWLERALAKHRTEALIWNQNLEFRPIHDDPRWAEFLRRIERHPDQLARIEFNPRLPN